MTVFALCACAVAFLLCAAVTQSRRPARGMALCLLAPAALALAAAIDLAESARQVVQFRLRGYTLPLSPARTARPEPVLLVSGPAPDPPAPLAPSASAVPRLRTPLLASDPADRAVRIQLAVPPAGPGTPAADRAPALAVECPADADILVALLPASAPDPWETDPSQLCNVRELEDGDRLMLWDRPFTFGHQADGVWTLGPCRFPMTNPDGTYVNVSLLDLYHHDKDCRPIRTEPPGTHPVGPTHAHPFDDARWIGVGRTPTARAEYEVPLRSFVTVRTGRVYLARLDGPSVLRTQWASGVRTTAPAPVVGPAVLHVVRRTFRLSHERLYERLDCQAAGSLWRGPSRAETCLCTYDQHGFCPRIATIVHSTRLGLGATADLLEVRLPTSKSMIVGMRAGPPSAAPNDETPAAGGLAAYSVGLPVSDPTRTLQFPFRLEGGGLLRAVFTRHQPCTDADPAPGRCIGVFTPGGHRAWNSGDVVPIGQSLDPVPGAERRQGHLVQVVDLGGLGWFAWLAALIFAVHAVCLWPLFATGAAAAGLVFMDTLLVLRVLLGYKVFALYPYDDEAIVVALVALAAAPLAYVLALRLSAPRAVRPLDRRFMLAITLDGALIAWLVAWGMPPETAALVLKALGALCVVFSLTWIARWITPRFPRIRPAAWRHGLLTLVCVTLGLAGVRAALAYLGRERIGGVGLDLFFIPASLVAVAWLWTHPDWSRMVACVRVDAALPDAGPWSRLRRSGRVVVAGAWQALLIALCIMPLLAHLGPGGDKGTPLTVVPAIVVAGLMMSGVRRPMALFVTVAAVGVLARIWVGSSVAIPPVAGIARAWESEGDHYCPGTPDAGARTPFSLDGYSAAVDATNIRIREWDFLHPGAAGRIGTRDASEVAQALAVMRRYAQGRVGATWGDGYLQDDLYDLGPSLVKSQLSDGLTATLIMPEFGTAGVAALLVLFGAWVLVPSPAADARLRGRGRFGNLLATLAALTLVTTAFYMVASNIGVLPLTGKDVPFLAVLSKGNIVLSTVLVVMAGSAGAHVGRAR